MSNAENMATGRFEIVDSNAIMKICLIGWIMLALPLGRVSAQAKEIALQAKVTYLSGGSVYVSAGRNAGVADSTLLYAIANTDTVAVLKVFAVSSKSAVCHILYAKRALIVGEDIVGKVLAVQESIIPTSSSRDSLARSSQRGSVLLKNGVADRAEAPSVSVQGRVALQYHTSQFENTAFNINQPGMVIGLRVAARDIPLTLELYGNMRMLSRGGTNPFSGQSVNESRLYRFSLEYDDHVNIVTLGRILPYYAPSIGSIDGLSYARRLGNLTVGASLGF